MYRGTSKHGVLGSECRGCLQIPDSEGAQDWCCAWLTASAESRKQKAESRKLLDRGADGLDQCRRCFLVRARLVRGARRRNE